MVRGYVSRIILVIRWPLIIVTVLPLHIASVESVQVVLNKPMNPEILIRSPECFNVNC
jgi:hypothetical protein